MGSTVFPAVGGGVTQKVQEFTSTGTFTAPANCSTVDILLVGGGGGGGGGRTTAASGNWAIGGGGGGAQVIKKTLTVTPGTSYTVTIGAGGAGAANGISNPAKGGDSSFGALLTAIGGSSGSSLDDSTNTWYATSINAGWNSGGLAGGTSSNSAWGWNIGGSSGGVGTFIGSPSPVVISAKNTASSGGNNGYANGYPGMTTNSSIMPGIAVDGLYGGGGSGGTNSSNSSTGVWYTINSAAANAGVGGNTFSGITNPVAVNGGAAAANYGGGGGGSFGRTASTNVDSAGGNGGSGYCRVTYWS